MKKFICVFLVLILTIALFCGCASKDMATSMENGNFYAIAPEAMDAFAYGETSTAVDGELELTVEGGASLLENRKLIREMSLDVETENFDALMVQVEQRIAICGGYAEHSEINSRYSSNLRDASLIVRVPADRLDEFTGHIGEISNVVYRTESNKDITTQYVDTQSHRDALKVEQERLMELLGKAETLTEVLEIENRLTDLRYELESMEAILRTYDNQVDYATLRLSIREVKVYTETEEKGFWKDLGDSFIESLESLGDLFVNIFAFLIVAFPYLLIFVGVPLVILIVLLRKNKKRKARNADTEH